MTAAALLLSLLAVICTALFLFGLRYGLRRSILPPTRQKRVLASASALSIVWFVTLQTLSLHGFFSDFSGHPPRFLFALGFPVLVLPVAGFFSSSLAATLSRIPFAWLVYFQTFRIAVELLLWRGFHLGAIPVQMTFEGRNFDILAGLAAIIVAPFLHRFRSHSLLVAYNVVGLALLANIVGIALLSMPTALRHFQNEPDATLLAHFPFILLPGVLVPLAFAAHLFSLRQIVAAHNVARLP